MRAASSLSQTLTLRRVKQLAAGASFQRGEAYFAEDRVRSLVERGETLTARVFGTQQYAVRLAYEMQQPREAATPSGLVASPAEAGLIRR